MSVASASSESDDYCSLGRDISWKAKDRLADKNGFRHNVYWVTGDLYRGYWSRNKKDGNGIHTYRNGDRYEGHWRNGKRDGQGTLWLAVNGKYQASYRGAWKNGKWHGKGTLYGENGEIYEGEFENGERCGTGKQTYWCEDLDTYEVYIGQWSHNKRNGNGILHMVNGDTYEGSYKDDMKEGKGVLYYKDNCSRYEGLWHADVPICGTYIRGDKNGMKALPLLEMKDSSSLAMDIVNECIEHLKKVNSDA
ncbi:hypothetical protein KP509_20G032000 [Ceratopteris richardii]|uniref:MORN repeat-containing protein 3 n=1 Tax=Ceratopteris richardii TaxID=49495 RepID=A0A8T2SEX6_CERRI|nr:hypothetical protein KP509_20G032000 [Ceratopteris richardii]KAH7331420.1 hypothetical protein KP509_20G032000 [Ceratopteris richardii]KAH7331421.1 hypothetical protein KP509_20G032000 [Ceratopteris richardii]